MHSRRDFLRQVIAALGGVGLAGAQFRGLSWLLGTRPADAAQTDLVWVEGRDPYANTVKALAVLGGMGRFVKPGQNVALLPNVGWARTPEQAGCTNPRVVHAVIDEAFKAGAKSITAFCNPCNDARVSLDMSGIGKEIEQTSARYEFINKKGWVRRPAVQGCTHIKQADVYRLVQNSDVLISIPIAKHHGSSVLTMCCKNLMGAVRDRGYIHQSLHEGIADLTMMIPTTLCVLDATRILVRNGPSSGNINDVVVKNTLIAGVNPLSINALGTTLFGKQPSNIAHLKILASRGFGTIDLARIKYQTAKA